MNNRIITPNQNAAIVDPSGREVASDQKEMPVTFEKHERMVIDRKRSNGARVVYTTVMCNGAARAWIIDVPVPPNMPAGAPSLCIWGFFSPEGEQILGRGTKLATEAAATEFARVVALNEIQNQIQG